MKNRIVTALGTLAASVGLVIGLGTVAQASADGPELCTSNARSCVWFIANGDYIYVNDGNADGHSAVAQVCSPGPSNCGYVADYFWNSGGSGTTYYWSMGSLIPEGATVYYRPCYGEKSTHTILGCSSGWTHGVA